VVAGGRLWLVILKNNGRKKRHEEIRAALNARRARAIAGIPGALKATKTTGDAHLRMESCVGAVIAGNKLL